MLVSLSASAKWLTQNTPCIDWTLSTAPLIPKALGATMTVLCPLDTPARYINVQLQGTGYLAVQEVTPFIDGGAALQAWRARPCAHVCKGKGLS